MAGGTRRGSKSAPLIQPTNQVQWHKSRRIDPTSSRCEHKEVGVLGDKTPVATVAVKNIGRAKQFYEGVLDLELTDKQEPGTLTYRSGDSSVLVYESQYAGTNKATAVTWPVGDVEGEVLRLRGKGVAFEHYDMPGMTRQGDVYVAGPMKAAWFKDPDGNIHAVVSD
jgi:predicted enzyme related to lactoylglutathione lyase